MKLVKIEELEMLLLAEIGEIQHAEMTIEKFFWFYEKYTIKNELEYEEEDMMLFQYGHYDWHDGMGRAFNFNLTRQFEAPESDEFLQLRLTLFFDSKKIGELEDFSCWSIDCNSIGTFENLIKQSDGYKKVQNILPLRWEVKLEET
ncbi:MAG: hypothetical protein R3B47_20110 [Bacteroidia bacterium]